MSFVRRRRRYILKLTYAVKMVHTKLFLLEKLIIAQLVKKFYAFDGSQRFNKCSQQPTTWNLPEPPVHTLKLFL
jgi:hypothetical protein